jgi:nitroimidazol reductase NimA-like FMN-containing flavoprotein (pyridoxamine 5'-phosphate oxidase superfamily)
VTLDRVGSQVLSPAECQQLLQTVTIGRVAVSLGALPVILPVTFSVVDGDIVFRTTPGTKLDAAATNAVVAFEVDGFDADDGDGWSVLVQGVAEEVTNPAEIRHLERVTESSWSGTDTRFVRIETRILSGRRLASLAG